jgi:hypothetical protein
MIFPKHLIDHFRDKFIQMVTKAYLVCSGREAAIKYQQTLHRLKEEGATIIFILKWWSVLVHQRQMLLRKIL